METALEALLGQGVLGIFLVIVIFYFRHEVKILRAEMKEKSEAHAATMQFKDEKIQALNDEKREDALQNMAAFNALQTTLEKLVVELKTRNDAGRQRTD